MLAKKKEKDVIDLMLDQIAAQAAYKPFLFTSPRGRNGCASGLQEK